MNISDISQKFNQAAEKYDQQRRFFIPHLDVYYECGIDFLVNAGYSFKSVLDLGAGTGLLSKYMYMAWPGAQYTLVDVADKMLDVARIRFEHMNNVEFIVADYSRRLPAGSFDLIASGLSIHHVENNARADLYRNIYESLDIGGCMLNLDHFNASTENMNRLYNGQWYEFIKKHIDGHEHGDAWRERRGLDRENTIEETLAMLRHAGFRDAECIYSYMKFGVIVAVK